MMMQGNFFYNIIKDEEDIFIYIPSKDDLRVKNINIKNRSIVLNYQKNKTYTIRDINLISIDKIYLSKNVWIVEVNKEKEIESAYKINIQEII
jgi:hypothetical protein